MLAIICLHIYDYTYVWIWYIHIIYLYIDQDHECIYRYKSSGMLWVVSYPLTLPKISSGRFRLMCVHTHIYAEQQTHLCGAEKSTILGRKDLFLKVIEYVPALILQLCYRFYRFYGKSVSYPSMMSFMGNYTHNIYIHIIHVYIMYIYIHTCIYRHTCMYIYIYTNMDISMHTYTNTVRCKLWIQYINSKYINWNDSAKNSLFQLSGTAFGKQRAVVAWRARAALWYRLRWPGDVFFWKWLEWLEYPDISCKDVDLKN